MKKYSNKIAHRINSHKPLGYSNLDCPPTDWRIPPVIDGYNSVIRSLCNKYNLPFLDTTAIIKPMWDHATDWNHLEREVALPEAFYLLDQML